MKTLSQDPYKENIADESPLDLRGMILEQEQDVNQGKVPNRTLKQSKTLDRLRSAVFNTPARRPYNLGVEGGLKDQPAPRGSRFGLGIMPFPSAEYETRVNLEPESPSILSPQTYPPVSPYSTEDTRYPTSGEGSRDTIISKNPAWAAIAEDNKRLAQKTLEGESSLGPDEAKDTLISKQPTAYKDSFVEKQPTSFGLAASSEPSSQIPTGAGVGGSMPLDRNFLTLLGRSAAQIGTLGGKAASAEPLADYIKSLEDKDRSMMGIAQKEKGLDQPISPQEAELTNAMLRKYGVDVDVTGMKRSELEKSPTLKAILDLIKYQEKPDVTMMIDPATGDVSRWDRRTGKQLPTTPQEKPQVAIPEAPSPEAAPTETVPKDENAARPLYEDMLFQITGRMGLSTDPRSWSDAQAERIYNMYKAAFENIRNPLTRERLDVLSHIADMRNRRLGQPSKMLSTPFTAKPGEVPGGLPKADSSARIAVPSPTPTPSKGLGLPSNEELRGMDLNAYSKYLADINNNPSLSTRQKKELINQLDKQWATAQQTARSEAKEKAIAERMMFQSTNRDIQALGKDLTSSKTNIVSQSVKLQNIVDTLDVYGDKELPGIGPYRTNLPAFFDTAEGKRIKSMVQDIINVEIKDMAGTNVTTDEMKRIRQKWEYGNFFDANDLKDSIRRYIQEFNAVSNNVISKYRPEVREEYQKRGGTIPEKIGPSPTPTTAPGAGETTLEIIRKERERRARERGGK